MPDIDRDCWSIQSRNKQYGNSIERCIIIMENEIPHTFLGNFPGKDSPGKRS